jgi:excisionase family DNA binding protein
MESSKTGDKTMDEIKRHADLMTVKEVCEYLQIHPITFYRWAKEEKIPALKIGGNYRVMRSKLDAMFEAK